jgi:hypothetical protein
MQRKGSPAGRTQKPDGLREASRSALDLPANLSQLSIALLQLIENQTGTIGELLRDLRQVESAEHGGQAHGFARWQRVLRRVELGVVLGGDRHLFCRRPAITQDVVDILETESELGSLPWCVQTIPSP